MILETLAPAKVNLYLHVTGRRADGYHFLDSLVTFASVGDFVRLEDAPTFSFSMNGPMATAFSSGDEENNLVVRAARALAKTLDRPMRFRLTLTKNLPIASGIGGGSTDAAATLRLLASHWGLPPDAPLLREIAAALGQDIPCCIAAKNCFFMGIGDAVVPAPDLPPTALVLVNPRKEIPTPAVFRARRGAFSPPADRLTAPPKDASALAAFLGGCSNDLTAAAAEICPEIREILRALESCPDCLLARMSGSGATCFGLFSDRGGGKRAAATLLQNHAAWWVVPTMAPAILDPLPNKS